MSGCIESKKTNNAGYGYLHVNRKFKYLHRHVWEQHNGPIPSGMVIRHTCDNPACYNIDHLEIGTQQDNMRDRDIRNRTLRGIDHANSKLTEDQVKYIKSMYRIKTQVALAEQFGVHRRTIQQIHHNKYWRHIQ